MRTISDYADILMTCYKKGIFNNLINTAEEILYELSKIEVVQQIKDLKISQQGELLKLVANQNKKWQLIVAEVNQRLPLNCDMERLRPEAFYEYIKYLHLPEIEKLMARNALQIADDLRTDSKKYPSSKLYRLSVEA